MLKNWRGLVSVAVLAGVALWLAMYSLALAQASSAPLALEMVATGFSRPVQVTHAGDGSGRLFVVEQDGRIKIIQEGTVLPVPFLDVSSLTTSPADGSGNSERGLLGLAFHPNYAVNGYFYINYTNNNGDTIISRYTVSTDSNQANPASALTILTVPQPYANHNGGQLLFSPTDGYLYIGLGDGGSGFDPDRRSQNPADLLGKMLRIDVDGGSPYAVPATNPFTQTAGYRDEIWALGLRNPWRFSFDRATGDMYIGDVGQGDWEEIDFQAAGAGGLNYGWRCREGAHNTSFAAECSGLSLTDPVAEYDHGQGHSVTGGFVYRGQMFPDFAGRYFYADYVNGKIWSIVQTGPGTWSSPKLERDTSLFISAFGEDEAGELYVADYAGGAVYRLITIKIYLPLITR